MQPSAVSEREPTQYTLLVDPHEVERQQQRLVQEQIQRLISDTVAYSDFRVSKIVVGEYLWLLVMRTCATGVNVVQAIALKQTNPGVAPLVNHAQSLLTIPANAVPMQGMLQLFSAAIAAKDSDRVQKLFRNGTYVMIKLSGYVLIAQTATALIIWALPLDSKVSIPTRDFLLTDLPEIPLGNLSALAASLLLSANENFWGSAISIANFLLFIPTNLALTLGFLKLPSLGALGTGIARTARAVWAFGLYRLALNRITALRQHNLPLISIEQDPELLVEIKKSSRAIVLFMISELGLLFTATLLVNLKYQDAQRTTFDAISATFLTSLISSFASLQGIVVKIKGQLGAARQLARLAPVDGRSAEVSQAIVIRNQNARHLAHAGYHWANMAGLGLGVVICTNAEGILQLFIDSSALSAPNQQIAIHSLYGVAAWQLAEHGLSSAVAVRRAYGDIDKPIYLNIGIKWIAILLALIIFMWALELDVDSVPIAFTIGTMLAQVALLWKMPAVINQGTPIPALPAPADTSIWRNLSAPITTMTASFARMFNCGQRPQAIAYVELDQDNEVRIPSATEMVPRA